MERGGEGAEGALMRIIGRAGRGPQLQSNRKRQSRAGSAVGGSAMAAQRRWGRAPRKEQAPRQWQPLDGPTLVDADHGRRAAALVPGASADAEAVHPRVTQKAGAVARKTQATCPGVSAFPAPKAQSAAPIHAARGATALGVAAASRAETQHKR